MCCICIVKGCGGEGEREASEADDVKRSVLQCIAVWCSEVQCVAVCCSAEGKEKERRVRRTTQSTVCCSVLQCAAVCCSALQCVAVCCSVLQCVAVRCSVVH